METLREATDFLLRCNTPADQRRVLDEFWADVDDNIKQGNLPKYE